MPRGDQWAGSDGEMEPMALYFSRDMMKVFKETIFFDNLESLFGKIKTTLPKNR